MNNHYISKLISIIILIFPSLFIVKTAIADTVLTTQVAGYYDYSGSCYQPRCPGTPNISVHVLPNDIKVTNFEGLGGGPGHVYLYWLYIGLMEFDISSIKGLYARGNISAKLVLTINKATNGGPTMPISVYSMLDDNENGVLQLQDINFGEYSGTLSWGPVGIDSVDVTNALEHDLFDVGQTDYSGFILYTPSNADDFFYTDISYSNPQLIISSTATLINLTSFTATPKFSKVIIQWSTETEIDNAGFNLYRAESEDGAYIKINASLIPAQGSSTQGAAYVFTDRNVQNRKTYFYKLEDIDLNGQSTMHGPVNTTPRLIYGIGK
jgi:hypothetical protein